MRRHWPVTAKVAGELRRDLVNILDLLDAVTALEEKHAALVAEAMREEDYRVALSAISGSDGSWNVAAYAQDVLDGTYREHPVKQSCRIRCSSLSKSDSTALVTSSGSRLYWEECLARAEAAEAEADRLKAALEQIEKWDCPEGWGGAGFAHVRQIARAALAPADRNTT